MASPLMTNHSICPGGWGASWYYRQSFVSHGAVLQSGHTTN